MPDVDDSPSPFLLPEEAARFLRLSPRTLEKKRKIGGGPPFRRFGRKVVYELNELRAWADQRSYDL